MTPADRLELAALIPDDVFAELQSALTLARAAVRRTVGAASANDGAYMDAHEAERAAHAKVGEIVERWLCDFDDPIVPVDLDEVVKLSRMSPRAAIAAIALKREMSKQPALRVVRGGKR